MTPEQDNGPLGEVILTQKEIGLLHAAARKCGLSYRSAYNRDIEAVRLLKRRGLLRMSDNGKERSRFVFWITEEGKKVLK